MIKKNNFKILGFFNTGTKCCGIDRHEILKLGQKYPKDRIKTYVHDPDDDINDYGLIYVLYIGKEDISKINVYLKKYKIPMESGF
jgi:hypothetical protein